jgi:hypothetical protein
LKWPHGLTTFVLVVSALLVTWQPTWDEPYAEDDYLFLDAALDATPRVALGYLTSEGVMDHHVRPLSDPLFFFALHAVDGTNPRAYHVALLALHGASAFLLAVLAWRLGLGRAAGTFAALVYVTRDFSYPSLVWASGISDIGSGFFVFLTLVLLARYIAGGRTLWRVGAIVAFVCALLVKETAVVGLGLAVLVTLALAARGSPARGSSLGVLVRTLWPLVAVSVPITFAQLLRADFESAGRELYKLELSRHLLVTWPAFLVWSVAGAKEIVTIRLGTTVVVMASYAALVGGIAGSLRRRGAPSPASRSRRSWAVHESRGAFVFVTAWFFVAMLPALLAPNRVLTNYLVLGGAGVSLGIGIALARLGRWSGATTWRARVHRAGSLALLAVLVAVGVVLVRWKDREKLASGGWVNVAKARAMNLTVRELATETLPTPDPGSTLLVFGALLHDVRVLGDPRREGFAPRQVLPSALRVAYARTDLDALSLPPIANTPPDLLRFVGDLAASEVVHVVRAEGRIVDVTGAVRRLAAQGAGPDELRRVVAMGGGGR